MDKLLSEKQVTDIVGFKRTKLYQMIKKGRLSSTQKIWKSE
jgi:predicted DNA-binding transcriptional regulator AlpA